MADLIAIDIVRTKVIEIKPKLDAAAARSDAIHRAVSAAQSRPLEDLLKRAKVAETDIEACAEILEMLLECKFIEDDFEMLARHLKPSPLQSISKKKGKKQSQTYLPFHLYMNTDFQDKFLDQEISPAAKADFLYVFMGDCGLRHGCEYTYKRMNSFWLVHTETPELIATMTAKSLWLMKNHVRDSFLSKHACFLQPPPSFCDELPENTATFLLQHPQLYEGILGKEPPPKKCLLKMLDVLNLDARYTCRNEGSDHERRNRSANSHNAFGTDLSLLPMHTARTAAPMLQDLCSQLVPALCLQLNSMFGDPSRRGGFMDASHHGNVPLTFNGLRRSNSDAEIEVLRDLQLDIQNRSYMRSRSTIATKERALPPALSSGPVTPDDSHPVVSMSQDSRQSQPSVASHEPILAPAPSAALAIAAAPAPEDSPGACIERFLLKSDSRTVAPPPQSLSAAVAPPPPPAPPPPAPPAPPARVGLPGSRRPRPRGQGGKEGLGPIAQWHKTFAAATLRDADVRGTLFLFRWRYPHPANRSEHENWVESLTRRNMWPSEQQLYDDSYQMLFPSSWRKQIYKDCKTTDHFYEALAQTISKRQRRRDPSWENQDWSGSCENQDWSWSPWYWSSRWDGWQDGWHHAS